MTVTIAYIPYKVEVAKTIQYNFNMRVTFAFHSKKIRME